MESSRLYALRRPLADAPDTADLDPQPNFSNADKCDKADLLGLDAGPQRRRIDPHGATVLEPVDLDDRKL